MQKSWSGGPCLIYKELITTYNKTVCTVRRENSGSSTCQTCQSIIYHQSWYCSESTYSLPFCSFLPQHFKFESKSSMCRLDSDTATALNASLTVSKLLCPENYKHYSWDWDFFVLLLGCWSLKNLTWTIRFSLVTDPNFPLKSQILQKVY